MIYEARYMENSFRNNESFGERMGYNHIGSSEEKDKVMEEEKKDEFTDISLERKDRKVL